jgi:hypothetical protein
MTEENRLTTEDLARAGRDVRGRQEEATESRTDTALVDREQSAPVRRAAEKVSADVPLEPAIQALAKNAPLFPGEEAGPFRQRWNDIQAGFVDEPRRAVQQADALVAEVVKRLAEMFAHERTTLEHQWDRGDEVTTEDLRIALQRYRSFFARLLSV